MPDCVITYGTISVHSPQTTAVKAQAQSPKTPPKHHQNLQPTNTPIPIPIAKPKHEHHISSIFIIIIKAKTPPNPSNSSKQEPHARLVKKSRKIKNHHIALP
ncbi:uncharacterized protein BO95DRAFT_432707 [Aspergillus brunneoviolaceus CBS 621.78]|uniref:Uncharacterized protein n=1 Tax=Aspergillus brunneoviolaceus CBS 621.78 TaxID=1450534 RepID=A0ACD1G699_9EURO|nr:hypothetical protein BO95DRAFT_432707 [Aspergillus brunneoviolaceus CBS 621.78]RAH44801.1 hypothetical protein BO95DRAFT_432707 [Aspergillus brunneoviolaceus CBS 621.78]